MSRISTDEYRNGLLWNGYDYGRQAWVVDGCYVRCGHPENMNCHCYGKEHAGEPSKQSMAPRGWDCVDSNNDDNGGAQ